MEKAKTTGQKGRLPLSASAPFTQRLLDVFSVRPHLARRQTPSHLLSPDSLRPTRCLSRALIEFHASTACVYTCAHVHTRLHTCPQLCLHLGALYVCGLSLNIPSRRLCLSFILPPGPVPSGDACLRGGLTVPQRLPAPRT